MRRRDFMALAGVVGGATALPGLVWGQGRMPRIVVFSTTITAVNQQNVVQGLADYGYIDGKNIVLEFLIAPTIDAVPEYAARLVASRPDVIITIAVPAPLALKSLTTTIPVVFSVGDPLPVGLVSNYQRPGGNMSGTMAAGQDVIPRQVQIIKDILPGVTRLASFQFPADQNYPFNVEQVNSAARALQMAPVLLDAAEGEDLRPLFQRAKEAGCQAAHFSGVIYFNSIAESLANMCIEYRLPGVGRESTARLGLLAGYYGTGFNMDPNLASLRRLGYYVDLVLKGKKPGDIPVEGPTNFTFVINLKTAKALGITIPQSALIQATEVIQ
jgi:putative ABC transport system substrate-binding protein